MCLYIFVVCVWNANIMHEGPSNREEKIISQIDLAPFIRNISHL